MGLAGWTWPERLVVVGSRGEREKWEREWESWGEISERELEKKVCDRVRGGCDYSSNVNIFSHISTFNFH